jgi:hypothetical protein
MQALEGVENFLFRPTRCRLDANGGAFVCNIPFCYFTEVKYWRVESSDKKSRNLAIADPLYDQGRREPIKAHLIYRSKKGIIESGLGANKFRLRFQHSAACLRDLTYKDHLSTRDSPVGSGGKGESRTI